ncbi:Ankyrin repeat domain-containing protein [Aromatoleum petrolei]|nr:Ankyrin repeat domain-containing protein [Aromatoleum petrolei]
MQPKALHRRANLRPIAVFAGIALFGFNGLALATAGNATFVKPFRPEFNPVARVSCPQSGPLPRNLIDAAACGDMVRLRARIAEGADLAATDSHKPLHGRTALHHAAQRGDREGVDALLAAGARPDAVDAAGNAPMHLVAMRRRMDSDVAIVESLIKAGTDARLRNAKGRTALGELLNFTAYRIDPLRVGVEKIGSMLDDAEAKGPVKVVQPEGGQAGEGQVSAPVASAGDESPSGEGRANDPLQAETAVREALEAWAHAWSARDIDSYLNHYAPDFRPADGRPLEQWRTLRRERIGGASSIDVKLAEVKILLDGKRAIAQFRQDYRSEALNSVDQKIVVFGRVTGSWRIIEERTAK